MYKATYYEPRFVDFYLPFGSKLRSDNRWVILAKLIPWSEFEENAIERIEVERMFGLGKRKYSVNLIMEKVPKTIFAAVALSILVMNLDKILRSIFLCLFYITMKADNEKIS